MGASARCLRSVPLTRSSTSLPASLKKGESFGLLLPFMTTTATTEPSGEILMPSGVWPTVMVLTTRGGLALRSMMLTVSALGDARGRCSLDGLAADGGAGAG